MIELRWKKEIAGQYLGGIVTGKVYHDPVLQYRVMENPQEIGVQDPIWSEWMDVPEEWEKPNR